MRTFVVSDHETIGARAQQVLLFEGRDCPASHVISFDLAAHHLAQGRPDLIVVVLSPNPVAFDPLRVGSSFAKTRTEGFSRRKPSA